MVSSYANIKGLTFPKQEESLKQLRTLVVSKLLKMCRKHIISQMLSLLQFVISRLAMLALHAKQKVIIAESAFGRCVSCNTWQRIDRCKMQLVDD